MKGHMDFNNEKTRLSRRRYVLLGLIFISISIILIGFVSAAPLGLGSSGSQFSSGGGSYAVSNPQYGRPGFSSYYSGGDRTDYWGPSKIEESVSIVLEERIVR